MAKGIQGNEPDPRVVYADIIDLPHHQSAVREHMSLYDRAAQFAPYAALVGYDAMINEKSRYVEQQEALSEDEQEKLNVKLACLAELLEEGETPEADVTYFEPDPFKQGGTYITIHERIKKIDRLHQQLILFRTQGRADTNTAIDMSSISEIHEARLDALDTEIP